MQTIRLGTDESSIKKAAELLQAGELVAFPTETVYGLGAIYDNEEAIKKIFSSKGRASDNPLIVHMASSIDISLLAHDVSPLFETLTENFYPGPLTLVVPKLPAISLTITGGQDTVAVRVPDHLVAYQLIKEVGKPIVAPSANTSGKPSPTTADHVLEDLEGKIAAVVDGGPCRVGIESTVLDITTYPPTILRPGHITKEQIEKVLQIPVLLSTNDSQSPKAPGMKYKHYSPNTPILLINSLDDLISNVNPSEYDGIRMLTNNHLPISYLQFHIEPLTEKTLYANFRSADKAKEKQIIIFLDDETKKNSGLMNRILKAATS